MSNEASQVTINVPAKSVAAPEPPGSRDSLACEGMRSVDDQHLYEPNFNIEPMRLEPLNGSSTDPPIDNREDPILLQWTQFTSFIHDAISRGVVMLSRMAATHPKTVLSVTVFTALALPTIGWFTNFRMEVEQEAILAPFNSLSRQHHDWIEKESNFPSSTRPFDMLIHRDGEDVLSIATLKKVFEALDVFRNTEGHDEICSVSDYELLDGKHTCQIHAATRFWWHDEALFEAEVKTEEDLLEILSQDEYPLGTPVGDRDFILGKSEVVKTSIDNRTTIDTLVSAQSYIIRIEVPVIPQKTSLFEDLVVENLLELRQKWQDDDTMNVQLEFFTFRSIPNEFIRAIVLDLPLYPAVFFIMCGFTCITFYRRDRVHSRCLLGIGAVVTIGLSLLTGCGLMFVIGMCPSSTQRVSLWKSQLGER